MEVFLLLTEAMRMKTIPVLFVQQLHLIKTVMAFPMKVFVV